MKHPDTSPPGLRALPARMELHGFPVVAVDEDIYAEARGVWPLKKIVVGHHWFLLNAHEQMAVLHHEAYHNLCFHLEKRLLALPLFWTAWAARWAKKQEFDADLFAALSGYRDGMKKFLLRFIAASGPLHPSSIERYRAI